jgi:hypothetical protein
MPIRFRDQRSVLARASLSLAAHTSAISGSFTAVVNRTGVISSGLTQMPAAFVGTHVFAQNRTGTIASTLQGATSLLVGGPQSADDWSARSANAVYANRLQQSSDLTGINTSSPRPVVIDTSVKVSGASGSARFDRLSTDGESAGQLRIQIPGGFIQGTTFYWSLRKRVDRYMARQIWPTNDNGVTGWKDMIMSTFAASNVLGELVNQLNDNAGMPLGYYQNSFATAIPWDQSISTACSGSDLVWQPGIDRGSNPLTGTDPDTGSAWSACQQDRARRGGLYSTKDAPANDWAHGIGDPISGAFRWYPDEWVTLTNRLIFGTPNVANSRLTCWAAREGQGYVLLADLTNIRLDMATLYDGFWPLGYISRCIAGGKQVTSRSGELSGISIDGVGLGTPTGAGTLEWNATTGRARFAASGESFGTARGLPTVGTLKNLGSFGHTAGGNILGGRHLVVERTGSLPSSGITTETVTIGTGRKDCAAYCSDIIISTTPIKAAGGFVPPIGAIGEAFAALAPGTWGTFPMTGMNAALVAGGVGGDHILSYTKIAHWDPIRRRVVFCGHTHEQPNSVSRTIVMNESGVWSTDGPTGETSTGNTHTGYNYVIDPRNGDIYEMVWLSNQGRVRRAGTGAYTTTGFAAYSNPPNGMNGCALNPYLDSGRGGFCYSNEGSIAYYLPRTNAWTVLSTSYPNLMGGGQNFAIFVPKTRSILLGGGEDTGGLPYLRMWQISESGVLTQRADLPGATGTSATMHTPITPTGNANPQWWAPGGTIREYNTSSNSFSVTGSLPFTAFDDTYFTCTIPEFGGLMCVYFTSAMTPSATARIYKFAS